MKKIILIIAFALSFANLFAQGGNCGGVTDSLKEDISTSERVSLLHMYEEEKLAGDVYKTLYEKWNLQIFSNISRAEERHQSSVASLLDKYQIEYTANLGIGKFKNKKLQKLYKELINKGNQSVEKALIVGATIEDLDIFDLDKAISKEIDNKDITQVYSRLRKGSTNHMRAFNSWLSNYNIIYEAQFITKEELKKIISQ